MSTGKNKNASDRERAIVVDARKQRELREQGYREQALKLFPHVCARCGREFPGKKLRELTVHHKDHNHDSNPHDGSNWELICHYCHENEHQKYLLDGTAPPDSDVNVLATHQPFADLKKLLDKKK